MIDRGYGTHARIILSILLTVQAARLMSKANVKKRFGSLQGGFPQNVSEKRHFELLLTEVHSAPISFASIFSLAGPLQERVSKGLRLNHSMFRRLLIHA
jgi:hypothetical protein